MTTMQSTTFRFHRKTGRLLVFTKILWFRRLCHNLRIATGGSPLQPHHQQEAIYESNDTSVHSGVLLPTMITSRCTSSSRTKTCPVMMRRSSQWSQPWWCFKVKKAAHQLWASSQCTGDCCHHDNCYRSQWSSNNCMKQLYSTTNGTCGTWLLPFVN